MRRSARGWVALGCAALAVNGILIVRIVQQLVTVHETSWQLDAQTVRGLLLILLHSDQSTRLLHGQELLILNECCVGLDLSALFQHMCCSDVHVSQQG